jgi:hypothetical protein
MNAWTRRSIRGGRIACALLIALISAGTAEAVTFQTTLSPIRMNAKPGETLTNQYHLTLVEGEPTTQFRVGVEDWWRSEDGRQSFYVAAGSLERSCGNWVSVNPAEARVAGGEKLSVRVTVNVPAGVRPGGYWCALTVEEVADPLAITPENVGVRFLTSVSTGIYVSIDPVERAVHIDNIEVTGADVILSLTNRGNTPVAIEGRVEFLKPGDSSQVASIGLERNVLLLDPIRIGRYSVPLPSADSVPPGRYLVRAILDIGLDHYIGAQRELLLEQTTSAKGR